MLNWYAVHCASNCEWKAVAHLQRQGFETYLPHYMRSRRHARRVASVRAPLFPRYLFIRMDTERQRWRAVNSTFGVDRLVCTGDYPSPVPDRLIDQIRAREDAAGVVVLGRIVPLRPGDPIRIVAGPMIDQTGIFECERDEDRVIILLDLLGRTTRVTARNDAIVSCA